MELKERACAVCGEMFIPKTPSGRYCCKECAREAYNAARRRPVSEKKIPCAFCGTLFVPTSNVQKYCSDVCYLMSKRDIDEQNREKARMQKERSRALEDMAVAATQAHTTYGKLQQQETIRILRENGFWGW